MDPLIIRREHVKDFEVIREVAKLAFADMPFGDGDEQELTDALRNAGALALSLVADRHDQVIGHVAISVAVPEDCSRGWYALGPVSVLPAYQRCGVGSALIRRGLEELVKLGATGCILTGDPDFYRRFGFHLEPSLAPPEEPTEYFMVKFICGQRATRPISFHRAFYDGA